MGDLWRTKLYQKYFRRSIDTLQAKTPANVNIKEKFSQTTDRNVPSYATRDNETVSNGGIREMQPQLSFSLTPISSSEVRRQSEASAQPTTIKPFLGPKAFSSCKSPKSSKLSTAQRLFSKNRFIKCIPACPHKTCSQKVSSFVLQQPVLSNDRAAIRSVCRSSDICSSDKLGGESVEIKRSSNNCLPGRFFAGLPRFELLKKSNKIDLKYFDRIRLDHKLGQIESDTNTQIRISGNHMGHRKQYQKHQYEKDTEDRKGSTSNTRSSLLDLEKSKVITGSASVRRIRGATGAFELPIIAKSREQTKLATTGSKSGCSRDSPSGCGLVVGKCAQNLSNICEKSNFFPVHRRIGLGLGSRTQWQSDVSAVEDNSKSVAYKHQGTFCSLRVHKNTYRNIERPGYCSAVRQPNGNLPYKKTRRYEVGEFAKAVKTPVGVVSSSEYNTPSTIHSRAIQLSGRLPLPQETFRRVESVPACHQENFRAMGRPGNRLVRKQTVSCSTAICQPRSEGQESGIHERIQSELGLQTSLGVPSTCVDATSPTASQQCRRDVRDHSTQVGEVFLESRSAQEGHCSTLSNSQPAASFTRFDVSSSSSRSNQIIFGGLENSGWSSLIKDWSPDNVALLENSWRKSTLRSYKSAWDRWVRWCTSNSVCHSNPSATHLALFLCHLHKNLNLAPRTIKVHKSVVCIFSNPSNLISLGSHPLVSRIIKGIELSKPPVVKKKIWDVSVLIKWLTENPPQEDSIFQLSRHVALLLLLSSGRRIHDLTLLHVDSENMIATNDSLIFWPKFGSKTDSARFRQSGWQVKSSHIKNLDIPFWTFKLISLSENRRKARVNLTNLFITTRGVVKAASRSVIAGWVRTALESVGIEAPPGSVRSAVASNNFDSLPLDEVLKKGNWRSEATFFKHYFKEVNRVDFNSSQTPNLLNESFKALS